MANTKKKIMECDKEQATSFFSLTPEKILEAVESFGIRCTGRCLPLNSMENRVYEVERELIETTIKKPSDRFVVAKFYRPGRWSRATIQAEHQFLRELDEAESPVICPLPDKDGETVHLVDSLGIYVALFPKQGGRLDDELSDQKLIRLGRLIARLHAVGARAPAPERMSLSPVTFGTDNLNFLLESGLIPEPLRDAYAGSVRQIVAMSEPLFSGVKTQRLHGDLHVGNILWADDNPWFVDFDDMVIGPAVQDIWLLVPGRDEESKRRLEKLLEGYLEFREFDRQTLRLIEPLRALRMIHFAAWIARRWEDPSFKRVFVNFGSDQYWREQMGDLFEVVEILSQ